MERDPNGYQKRTKRDDGGASWLAPSGSGGNGAGLAPTGSGGNGGGLAPTRSGGFRDGLALVLTGSGGNRGGTMGIGSGPGIRGGVAPSGSVVVAPINNFDRLPEDVLGSIITLLGTRDGARTAILSKRWRYQWRFAPLNLDDGTIGENLSVTDRIRIINKIQSVHMGPVRRVSLSFFRLHSHSSRIEKWLEDQRFSCMGEVALDFPRGPGGMARSSLPNVVLKLESLRVVSVTNCKILAGSEFKSRQLSSLELRNADITQPALDGLILNAPSLETLVLAQNSGYSRIYISNLLHLQTMYILLSSEDPQQLKDVQIRGASGLRSFYINNVSNGPVGPTVQITGSPLLDCCGCFGERTPRLTINTIRFSGSFRTSLVGQLVTVQKFAVLVHEDNLHHVADLLVCFPRLVTLHITVEKTGIRLAKMDVALNTIPCVQQYLRSIVLFGHYPGGLPLDFCYYYIRKANVLDSMVFCSTRRYKEQWFNKHSPQLIHCQRASLHLRFYFAFEVAARLYLQRRFTEDDPFASKIGATYSTF